MPDTTHYQLEVVCVRHPSANSQKLRLYTEVILDKTVRRTGYIDGLGEPLRDSCLPFTSSNTAAVFTICLKEKTKLNSNRTVGRVKINIATLLEKSGREKLLLLPIGGGTIYLRLKIVDVLARAEIEVMKAEKSIEQIGSKKDCTDAALACIVKAMDAIFEAVDDATAVSPLLSLAWKVTSALYKVGLDYLINCSHQVDVLQPLTSAQMKTDQELIEMVDKMRRAFDFSVEAGKLGDHVNLLRPLIKDLLDETVKCSHFVQGYASRSFFADKKVVDYTTRFADLRKELDSQIALNTMKLVEDHIRTSYFCP
ncbi:hypothetical protein ACEPAH_7903 [Sanghuangporus vaninii]